MTSKLRNQWLTIFGGLFSLAAFLPVTAFAEDAVHEAAKLSNLAALGCALGLGLAVLGAAGAQGKIAGSYMEGVSRNPGAEPVMKTQFILGLVFVETLVIFTVGIVAWLVTKM